MLIKCPVFVFISGVVESEEKDVHRDRHPHSCPRRVKLQRL